MSKLVKKEQHIMHQHPVMLPAIVIGVGAVLLVLGLIYLVYRSYNPKQDPQDMNHPVQQLQENEAQQYQNGTY